MRIGRERVSDGVATLPLPDGSRDMEDVCAYVTRFYQKKSEKLIANNKRIEEKVGLSYNPRA